MSLSLGMGLGLTMQRDGWLHEYFVGGVAPVFVDDFEKSRYYNQSFKDFDGNNTFTRASIGSYVNSAGLVKTAISGDARFTYNPLTLSALGLMVEAASTNTLLNSDMLSGWASWNTGSSPSTVLSPDGINTVKKIIPDNGVSESAYYQIRGGIALTEYTGSMYLKAAEFTNAAIELVARISPSEQGRHNFDVDLTDGSVNSSTSSGTGFTGISTSVVYVGNGWYHLSITGTTAASIDRIDISNNISSVDTGDASSGYLSWGAQLEEGGKTSYIPTSGSTVTRNTDVVATTGVSGTLDVRTTYHDDTVQDDLAESVTEGYWPTLTDSPVKSVLMYPSGTL